MELPNELTHPAFFAGIGAFVGYALILAVLTVAIFLLPYLVFSFL